MSRDHAKPFGFFYELPGSTQVGPGGPVELDSGVYLGCSDEHAATICAADEGKKPFPLYAAPPDAQAVIVDLLAHLAGAASAYRAFANRAPHLGKVPADALFTTRAADFDQAVERGRAFLRGETK